LRLLSPRVCASPSPTLFPYTTLFRSSPSSSVAASWRLCRGGREQRADACDEVVELERLRDVVRGTELGRVETLGHAEDRGHDDRSEEHTSELQSRFDLVCRLLLEKKI